MRLKPTDAAGSNRLKRVLVAGALCVITGAPVIVPGHTAAASARAGAVPESLVISGEFRIGETDRTAGGETLQAIAGRDLRQMVLCSTTTTQDNGQFMMIITPGAPPPCSDRGHNGGRGPVAIYLVWRGQQVGGISTHYDPSAPRDKNVRALAYARFTPLANTDPLADLADRPLMVARRFYGAVIARGRAVTTPVVVAIRNRGVPCGQTRTQPDGRFMLDLATDPACACPAARGQTHHPDFTFTVEGREVHGRNLHMHYDAPQTMGKVEMITLVAPWLVGR
jgi:hypothetical protein